jgi:hypothetical protein
MREYKFEEENSQSIVVVSHDVQDDAGSCIYMDEKKIK